MDQMASIRDTFFQECEEQMQALEQGLMTMEEGDHSSETVNAVFRAVHSVKGGAGAFKLAELVSFAHAFETVLDKIRSNQLVPEPEVMRLLLRSADILSDLVSLCREGAEIDASKYAAVLGELNNTAASVESEPEEDFGSFDFAPTLISIDLPLDLPGDAPAGGAMLPEVSRGFRIQFRPHADLYRNANEPLLLFRQLKQLGTMKITCDASRLPDLASYQVSESYLAFTIELETEASVQDVSDVFEFVDGTCDLDIQPLLNGSGGALPFVPLTEAPMFDPAVIMPAEAAPAPAAFAPLPELPAFVAPEIRASVAAEIVPPVVAAPATQKDKPAPSGPAPTIRVELDRVDRLINLVGELVINQAMLAQRISPAVAATGTEAIASLEELERLTRDLQDSVMAIRAQPVKSLFQRMQRIVREVADSTGKNVRLRTEGEAAEVDKTVIESLADPLTHMIRNAVDHGLESPADRLAAGKPEEGTIRLTAAHQSGKVVITVQDDGAGINRPKVLEIAKRKNLVPQDAQFTDSEIDNLLFLPGFSTATTVSAISGRGVGMDVVRRSIQALGGRINISSTPGKGSSFTLSLPLTLAVLDGIVVSVANEIFIIPLTSVVETLQPESSMILDLGQGSYAMRVRERLVPLVDVGRALNVRAEAVKPTGCVAILVDTESHSRSALLVDRILDQRQVVIKSFEHNYGPVPGVAAATILGDGRVAMILDVETIADSKQRERMEAGSKWAKAS
ncbi:chemotaxis protein CheA [Aestuariivirga litoralis]|uniref:chemotaxis protein CheA n=1 Tax=Aestuariivirga litoralis TaxID=2650924 RepID=UPI0018C50C09|nr:chemotaxis protein CheA [Aestuariivirga litoralis]MBG1233217.1 chemotaxis protein CheA [Aestuariivirga litoralis]